MQLDLFFDAVESHEQLRGVAVGSTEDVVAVEHVPTGLVTVLPAEAVESAEWELIESVLVCEREPQVLYHMTRVVGYYSRVENWNSSKIGELEDRHSGSYAVPEAVAT